MSSSRSRVAARFFMITVAILVVAPLAIAQTPATSATTSTAPATTQVVEPTSGPTSLPITPSPDAGRPASSVNVSEYAESTARALRSIEAVLSADETTGVIAADLGPLETEIATRASETSKLLSPSPSLDTLRSLERDWTDYRKQLSGWSRQLSERAADLRRVDEQLIEMQRRSVASIDATKQAGAAAELQRRVESIGQDVDRMRRRAGETLAHLQLLQERIAVLDVQASDTLTAVRDARASAVGRLLDRDSPPLWQSLWGNQVEENLAQDSRNTFRSQWAATRAYTWRQFGRVLLHLALVGAFAMAVVWLRRRWTGGVPLDDPAVHRGVAIFALPIPTAIVLTLLLVPWLYPQAPRLFMAILYGALLIPAVFVLRQLVMRPLVSLLYAIVVFYLVGLAVSVTSSLPALSRTIFLGQMVGGATFLAIFLRRAPRSVEFPQIAKTLRWRIVHLAVRVAMPVMVVSAIANLLGFVSVANLLGRTTLISAYVAINLDAALRVADAVILAVMQLKPFGAIGLVRRHGSLLRHRIVLILSIAAAIRWASVTLELLSLREPLVNLIRTILVTEWGAGAIRLSLGGLLTFAAVVASAFYLSRVVRFLLDEDVYPRLHLARGVPNAISTILHYTILFVGFLLAVAALGYDMTKFTILAGAFGVGLGFGMQNIVNNFVSGLIMLFERPIQVGDVIELDAATVGTVVRIGIRASIIRLSSSAEVIVPNGTLIAGRVTNWTLSNRQRGFEIEVTLPAGGEPERAVTVLNETARRHARVAVVPQPHVTVEFAGAGALKLRLHVWTDRYDDWLNTKSDLVIAVDKALASAGVQRA